MDRFRLWIITLLLAFSIVLLIRFSSIAAMSLFAIGLAWIFMPAVNGLETLFVKCWGKFVSKKPITRKYGIRVFATLFVILLTLFLIVIFTVLFIPYLIQQISDLIADSPAVHTGFEYWVNLLELQLERMNIPIDVMEPLDKIYNEIDSYMVDIVVKLVTWLAQAGSGIFSLLIVIILQVYFLIDGPRIIQLGRDYLLQHHLNRVAGFLRASTKMVGRYFKTQALISGSMVIVAFFGLKIAGVSHAGLFAVILFIVDFVPYIGPITGTLVVIAFTLFTGGLKSAVIVGIFLIILQQVEGNLVAPKVQGKTAGVHVILIILSLLACFELWGPIGMIFSVTLAGMAKIFLADVFEYLLHPNLTIGEFLKTGYPREESQATNPVSKKAKSKEQKGTD